MELRRTLSSENARPLLRRTAKDAAKTAETKHACGTDAAESAPGFDLNKNLLLICTTSFWLHWLKPQAALGG